MRLERINGLHIGVLPEIELGAADRATSEYPTCIQSLPSHSAFVVIIRRRG